MGIFSPSKLFSALSQEPRSNAAQGATGSQATAQRQEGAGKVSGKPQESILPEDRVKLQQGDAIPSPRPKLNLSEYKLSIGQEVSYIRETLRNKIAEYGLPARTQLQVTSDNGGNLRLDGRLPESIRERITEDLNNNRSLKASYARLSQEAPTLSYVDTVMKISSTYGVSNSLFDSIVSQNNEHNGLNDLSLRMGRVRQSVQDTLHLNLEDRVEQPGFSVSA